MIIKPVKNRELAEGSEILVYRNLNSQGRVFSIKDKKTGLVVAHADGFRIENVTTKISEAGRQRALKEKCKNVHSYLKGIYTGECEMEISNLEELYYNPYTLDHFINKETGEKVESVDLVYFKDGKAYVLKNK